jgi:hypothetical protein
MNRFIAVCAMGSMICLGNACSTKESRVAALVTEECVAAPRVAPALDARTAGALITLRGAEEFQRAYVGDSGEISRYVVAFRILLAHERAAALFREVMATGTPAGELYALCGLYLTDPEAFGREATRLGNDDTEVETMNGCMKNTERVRDVVRSPYGKRVVMRAGDSLDSSAPDRLGKSISPEISGGYIPLDLINRQRRALRDGLP